MSEQPAFDRIIEEFELAWRDGPPPLLEHYVDQLQKDQVDDSLLIELVCIDLECRWRRRRRSPDAVLHVEDYLHRIPQLSAMTNATWLLAQEEYRARRQWGDQPDHASFVQRFPNCAAEIREQFTLIDREVAIEQSHSSVRPQADSPLNTLDLINQTVQSATRLQYRDYVLHKRIGAGQMGRVYRATDLRTGNTVAVKYLRKSFLHNKAAVIRFLQEADLAARLRHPRLVNVHGVGATPGGGCFFAMEFLDGPDLATVVNAGPVKIPDAVRWTLDAAQAIEHLNRAGIIHCDLKPANLVLDKLSAVRVTDYGLATTIEQNTRPVVHIAGTAPYMAPEQVSAWWGSIGPPTDVYGLGAVLYSLITGQAPFVGHSAVDILTCVVSGMRAVSAQSLRPEINGDLAAVIDCCLSKNPSERYPTADVFAEALRKTFLSSSLPEHHDR